MYHAPVRNSMFMSYGIGEAIEHAVDNGDKYSEIVIDGGVSEPQMFVAFYAKVDPQVVHEASVDWLRYQKEGLKFVDQLGEYRLGKFVFRNIDKRIDAGESTLYIGAPNAFPVDVESVKQISSPDGEALLLLVEDNHVAKDVE